MSADLPTTEQLDWVAIEDLVLDAANPRAIATDQADALEASVRAFGLVQSVVARHADRTVIAGHQRIRTAIRLGHTHVPVRWVDADAVQAKVLGLALNRIGGTWDEPLLARLLAELGTDPAVD